MSQDNHHLFDELFPDDDIVTDRVFRSAWLGWLASGVGYSLFVAAIFLLIGSAVIDARVLWGWLMMFGLTFGIHCLTRGHSFGRSLDVVLVLAYLVGSFGFVHWWFRLDSAATTGHIVASLLAAGTLPLMKIGPKLRSMSAMDLLRRDGRMPVLYLRRFSQDADDEVGDTHETMLVDAMSEYGPVVAIGRPGERLQVIGASRMYVTTRDDVTWKKRVEQLMARAQFVVLRIGPLFDKAEPNFIENWDHVSGYAWEIYTALKSMPVEEVAKKVLLYHPLPNFLNVLEQSQSRKDYKQFCEQVGRHLGLKMPEELGKAPFVAFDTDGSPRLLGASPDWLDRLIALQQSNLKPLLTAALRKLKSEAIPRGSVGALYEARSYPWFWSHLRNVVFSIPFVVLTVQAYQEQSDVRLFVGLALFPHLFQLLLFRSLDLRLDQSELVARFGLVPLFSTRVPVAGISGVTVQSFFYYYLRCLISPLKRKTPIGWGRECIVLQMGKHEIGINTDNAAGLWAALESVIATNENNFDNCGS